MFVCISCVLVQSPLSLVLLPPLQPVYATSYFTQLSCPSTLSAVPLHQILHKRYQNIPVIQLEVSLPKDQFLLNVLSLLDSGIYTCSVRLISSYPYVIASDYTNGSTGIQITSKK